VSIVAREVARPEAYAGHVVVDVWTTQALQQGVGLQIASESLEAVRAEVVLELDLLQSQLEKHQEFLALALPRFISRQLETSRARAAIGAHFSKKVDSHPLLPTVRVKGDYLSLGPEPPGAVDAVQRYLDVETSDRAMDSVLTSSTYPELLLLPFAVAAVLVLAWLLPVRPWAIGSVGGALLMLIAIALRPVRQVGFRATLRQTPAVVSAGLLWIATFGIAYATCALVWPGTLGKDVPSLGYAFLVSTGLGVAGGILGENPTGIARIVAHIQLLMFLSGLAGVVLLLLRIERNVRRRG